MSPETSHVGSPESHPVTADSDLNSMPMADLKTRLGSAPEGLSKEEAARRLDQYGPNEIAEKKTNALLKFLGYFWGPIPWMIEVAVVLSAAVRPLGGFRHHLRPAARQRPDRLLGGAAGRQRDRRAEGEAGFDSPGATGRRMDHRRRRANWCPATSSASGSATSSRPTRACSTATRSRSTNRR